MSSRQENAEMEVPIYLKDKTTRSIFDTLKMSLKYGFEELNLHVLFGEIFEYNKANIKLFEKCGFKKDAILRHRLYRDGKYWDSIFYSILEKEAKSKIT